MKVNFTTLLEYDDQTPTELLLLPTEDDLFHIFQNTEHEVKKNTKQPFEPLTNEPCRRGWRTKLVCCYM